MFFEILRLCDAKLLTYLLWDDLFFPFSGLFSPDETKNSWDLIKGSPMDSLAK